MNDAQRELYEKLNAPLYTADDCMVMAEAANEIRYLAELIDALERQAARRTTPDRDSIIEAAQALLRDALDEVRVHPCDAHNDEVRANGLSENMYALYLALTAAPNGEKG
ncbi:hypothetical protein [Burkholderia sp. BCC0405]|uniref:hypothetical protein n=1 Tax=Burkholderia sp. BCC0405 TaxID=2676298 RepID=UPI00158ED8AB|nr:hypothetical protein [Burkholderia sp. BCC0405]